MGKQSYAFKHFDIDLKEYIEHRKFIAAQKRREAEILLKVADAIETECAALSASFIPCDPSAGNDD